MCGVPGQTITSWSETLARAAATGAHHASVYPLSIEDGTPMSVAITAGLLAEPDPDTAAEMMVLAEATLGYHGLARYEVANYAETREYESRHNTAYWTGRPYVGVGPGAHGMLDAADRACGGPAARSRGSRRSRALRQRGFHRRLARRPRGQRRDADARRGAPRGRHAGDAAHPGRADARRDRGGTRERHGVACRPMAWSSSSDAASDGARWRTTRRGWLLGNVVFGRIWAGE